MWDRGLGSADSVQLTRIVVRAHCNVQGVAALGAGILRNLQWIAAAGDLARLKCETSKTQVRAIALRVYAI